MLFRQHRGGYKESMETAVEIGDTWEDLREKITEIFPELKGMAIQVEHYVFDSRNNWDTCVVTNPTNFGVLGFTNRMPMRPSVIDSNLKKLYELDPNK